jgi:phosphate transport system permease protein
MKFDFQTRRHWTDRIMTTLCALAAVAAFVPLFSLILYVTSQGVHRFDWAFFTHLPAPVGEVGGGMANAVVGTITLVILAGLVGIPVGLMAGIFLAEFGGKSRFATVVRFTADVLSGVPSIVIGIVAYQLVVRPMGHFSAYAGGMALGFMMIPMVTRTTEELVKLIPLSVRESSLALGIPMWKTILRVVVATARNGILTGVLLAVARIAGETAPLLFTSFNNQYWAGSPNQPTASLTVQVFTYAISPFDDWHAQAWTGALALLILVLSINLAARRLFKNSSQVLR